MDYPNSVPSAGLVDGKFVDESPLTGAPGSLIPASWGNGVTQELLNVIRSAGINPAEGVNNQLLTALRSNGLFVTAPQFDNGNTVATTAFVTRSGLQFSGFASYAASATLTASNVGGVSSFSSVTPITATLPVTTDIAHVATINIVNAGSGALTVSAAPGPDTVKASNGVVGSIVLGVGETAEFLKLENQWRLIGGTISLKYASLFSGMNGNPGYQKHSSGNIDQWGYGTTDANGEVFVTFPISFPTAFVSVVATHVGGDGAMVIMLAGTATKQGCRLKVRDMGGSARAGWGVTYFAKGY
jgi:hypothetical protein